MLTLTQLAGLPLYKRLDGVNFAKAACESAHDKKIREQRFRYSDNIAFIYSAGDPDSSETLNYIAPGRVKECEI